MTVPGGEVRLRRSLGARLFAGWALQPILTLAVILNLILIALVSTFDGPSAFTELLPALPFYVVWIAGVTATAHADADGIRWRYFVPRRFGWNEIQGVEFGGTLRAGLGTSGTPAILVSAAGRRHPIGPAFGVRSHYLAEFAEGLRSLASAHGVSTSVHPDNVFWGEVLGR